jgi:hypothetical protein
MSGVAPHCPFIRQPYVPFSVVPDLNLFFPLLVLPYIPSRASILAFFFLQFLSRIRNNDTTLSRAHQSLKGPP